MQPNTYSQMPPGETNDTNGKSTTKKQSKKVIKPGLDESDTKLESEGEPDSEDEVSGESGQAGITKGFKKRWLIPYSDLVFEVQLGQGAYGIVFKYAIAVAREGPTHIHSLCPR